LMISHPNDIWASIPIPLDQMKPVPSSLIELVVQGHRWFKPELVDQTLYNTGGHFEPGLMHHYASFLNAQQMKALVEDIKSYISHVPDDVFRIDPDRYVNIRTNQVIQLDNPSGFPVFVHQKPMRDDFNYPTLTILTDANVEPRMKLILNDAACKLWGYTNGEFDSRQAPSVFSDTRESGGVLFLPFFFLLFSSKTVSTLVTLSFCIWYLKCKFARFDCEIMLRDGRLVSLLFAAFCD
jgi:hypothetical protein